MKGIEISLDVLGMFGTAVTICATLIIMGFYGFKYLGIPIYNHITLRNRALKSIPELADQVEFITNQLKTNGSTSLRDIVLDIREKVSVIDEKQRIFLMDEMKGIFETNKNGEFIYVNRTLWKMLGVSEHEVRGNGWKNFLVTREEVLPKWQESILNRIEFKMTTELKNENGSDFPAIINAKPITVDNKFVGYIGTVEHWKLK